MKEINQYLKTSNLFLQIKLIKVKLNIPLAIAAYFLLWLIGLGLGRLLVMSVLNALDINGPITNALRKLVVCGAQIVIFFLWVKFIERRPIKSIGFQATEPLKSYAFGLLIGLGTITTITLSLLFLGTIQLKYSPLYASNLGVMVLAWIVQSASEEIAIRGWLIPRLQKNCSPAAAISITAIIFGILHLFSNGVTALSFINLILSGIFFAGYAILNGNIWGVCGLHFAWNFALGSIYGFPVSGFSNNGGNVFQAQQTGSSLLTGGDFGPEGGLVTTIILLIAVALLILKWKKDSKIEIIS